MMEKVVVIAEAGVNHNGSIETAIALVDAAVKAGADIVKFQTFKAERLVSPSALKADYQLANAEREESQLEMLKRLELSESDFELLNEYCRSRNIGFLSTAFDTDGLDFLHRLGLHFFKVPSGEITNYPYLQKLASFRKPVILSTGMATMEEIRAAVSLLTSNGLQKNEITILHCTTEYPAPFDEVNLKAMLQISKEFGVRVGYSDHTKGIEVPIAAVALGAEVIEKHFTLDRSMSGPDHRASIEPLELENMVASIRNVEQAIAGSGFKEPTASEKKNILVARKSLHWNLDLKKGHKVMEEDIIPLRPGSGISPMLWNQVIGKVLSVNVQKNSQLRWEDFVAE